MQERLNQIIEQKGLTATKFATLIGVNASTISHILAGRNKPGFDIINNIAKTFPDISLSWLITGNGSMYNSPVTSGKSKFVSEPTLFDSGENEKQITSYEQTAIPSQKNLPPEVIAMTTAPNIKSGKRIKRIILFFDDGGFEDYEK